MTIILDGKALATKRLEKLKQYIQALDKTPKLAVILVGNDTASKIYTSIKEKRAREIGIESLMIELPEETTEDALLEHIDILNSDENISAILVQLPLPEHINKNRILERILPEKDVDGFNPINMGRLMTNIRPNCYPCTPLGIIKLLEEYRIGLEGKHAVVVGRSNIVGKPLAQMLLNRGATVTMCHSKTQNLSTHTKSADILISAVGKPELITKEMIKMGAVVVDVGISRIENENGSSKIVGDVDFEGVQNIAGAITPVPGGVGPMTICMLMENTIELHCKLNNNFN